MKSIINKGVYPVMITPFNKAKSIDYDAVDKMVEFYVNAGCQGIFAVCQSSEFFYLTMRERVELAKHVVKAAKGRLSVVASGHISDDLNDQIKELNEIAAAGVNGVVLVSNRLAGKDETDTILINRLDKIIKSVDTVPLGMYECPHPYKRLLSEHVLTFMRDSNRFAFIKDTCCDAELIKSRIKLLNNKADLFNANSATLLESLQSGAAGFSGVMANFHPDLYVWLYKNFNKEPEKAKLLSAFLSLASGIERGCYPATAKYHMNLVGIPMETICRSIDYTQMNKLHTYEVDDLIVLEEHMRSIIK